METPTRKILHTIRTRTKRINHLLGTHQKKKPDNGEHDEKKKETPMKHHYILTRRVEKMDERTR